MLIQQQLSTTVLNVPLPDLEIRAEPTLLVPYSLPFAYRFAVDGPAQLAINFISPTSISWHQLTARTYFYSIPGLHLVRHGFVNRRDAGLSPLLGSAEIPAYFDGWPLYLTNLLLNDESEISLARLGLMELNAEMVAMLVIDTGIHQLDWTKEVAIDFLIANTAISKHHAERLVDEVRFRPASLNSPYLGMTQIQALLADNVTIDGEHPTSPSWQALLAAGPVAASLQQTLRAWLIRAP
jgi:uncharacterized protein (DUF885 family)